MEGTAVKAEEVRAASARLPERQREALELRDREQRSYEEIAAVLEMSVGAVAQLISRARINLYDELRGTALASVPPSPDCARALSLIAAREDGQLDGHPEEVSWLDAHLADCDRCRLGAEQTREADAVYRSSAPPGVLADSRSDDLPASLMRPDDSPASLPPRSRRLLPRKRMALAGGLAALLLLGGVAAALVANDGGPAPVVPAVDTASRQSVGQDAQAASSRKVGGKKGRAAKKNQKASATTADSIGSTAGAAGGAATPVPVPVQTATGNDGSGVHRSGSSQPSGKAGVQPTKQTSPSRSTSKSSPAPTATPTSQPSSEPPPTTTTETPTTTEESPGAPGRSGEAPGKPSGHPSH
jgi:Sigma-70, region 4